jgi:hypothetical protein
MKEFDEIKITYIELSDGRVGYVEDVDNQQFKDDLERLELSYELTTANAYNRYMVMTKLSPEQIYKDVLKGKILKENNYY